MAKIRMEGYKEWQIEYDEEKNEWFGSKIGGDEGTSHLKAPGLKELKTLINKVLKKNATPIRVYILGEAKTGVITSIASKNSYTIYVRVSYDDRKEGDCMGRTSRAELAIGRLALINTQSEVVQQLEMQIQKIKEQIEQEKKKLTMVTEEILKEHGFVVC